MATHVGRLAIPAAGQRR